MKQRNKDKINRFAKGSISILLSILLSGVLSLGALMVEGSRYQEAQKQLDEAAINSALSLLASYDEDLAERFGLYGIDSTKLDKNAFLNYLLFNSDGLTDGSYSANDVSKLYNLLSGSYDLKYDLANYQVLKRQILEYEKYRAPLNVAADLLDVDKMLKKLKENIIEAIPGLEEMLDVCKAITELAEAIKALYCLYKDVQQLQMTIGHGDSWGDELNKHFGYLWEGVEGLFSDKEWPSHDPTYEEAYDNLKSAINDKVRYTKKNPPPAQPGPKPSGDLDGARNAYKAALSKYDTAELMVKLIIAADYLGYFDTNGLVNPSEKISDLLKKDITTANLKTFNLSKKSTRNDLLTAINNKVSSVLSEKDKMSSFAITEVAELVASLQSAIPSLKSDLQAKKSKYLELDAKFADWNEKNEAYTTYNEKTSKYNEEITTARDELLGVVDVLSGELDDYKKSLSKVVSAINKAEDSLKAVKDNKEHVIKTEKEDNIFTYIRDSIVAPEIDKPDDGIDFLNDQRDALNALTAESITSSYSFGSHFSTGGLYGDDYYMSKGQVTAFCTALAGMNVLEGLGGFVEVIKALGKMVRILNAFPSTYNFDCNVTLNSSTASILPSTINGGAGTTEEAIGEDLAAISAMLGEASELTDSKYANDIAAVNPNDRLEEAALTAELTERINRLGTNLGRLMGCAPVNNLLNNTNWKFISLIFSLVDIVKGMIEMIDDIIFIAKHFKDAVEIIVNSLGESLLINQYAIEKFPNRTSKNSDIDGYAGDQRKFFPDPNEKVQTFSGAQVEYIIGGSGKEKTNQVQCFWSIFVIRAINNIFAVINTPSVMDLIAACNIAAPLVFIAWVYMESNIDMNMLLADMEVPLIKEKLILSPETLTENATKLERAFDDIDEEGAIEEEMSYAAMKIDNALKELLSVKGLFKMKYETYLWFFLFFTPNQTKVMRIADLAQMEIRFKNQKDGATFLMKNAHTYVRCETLGAFNSVLPVISLSDNSLDDRGLKVDSVKYVGY